MSRLLLLRLLIMILMFVSYDLDILEEVYTDQVAVETLAIAQKGKSIFLEINLIL